ncbi:MAG TPA: tetratricopeptide repeat protein, partial [Thermoplasmata archaeon]|nr:tetratricopeptide repeat protein [Thermoplasmata archaeon]
LKPGFLPARVGIGRALLGLGLTDDADRAFDEVLAIRPEDVEARLGKAAVLGARARPKDEVAVYRKLLQEDASRTEVRAHLLAALIEAGDWSGARGEIEALLVKTPEEPQLRFLHSEALMRTGEKTKGQDERLEARRLGLSFDRESALCKHLGLPAPEPPSVTPGEPEMPPGTASAKAPAKRRSRGASRARRPSPKTSRRSPRSKVAPSASPPSSRKRK